MKTMDFILDISDGNEAIRIDFASGIRRADFKVLMEMSEKEHVHLYMVVPRRSISRRLLHSLDLDNALVDAREIRAFLWFGPRRRVPKSDLVWKPLQPDFPMKYGWHAFYVFDRQVALETIRDHYARLRKQKGLLDDIACFRFDRSEVLNLEGLMYLGMTAHDLEALRAVPAKRSLNETAEIALSIIRDDIGATGVEQQRYVPSEGQRSPRM